MLRTIYESSSLIRHEFAEPADAEKVNYRVPGFISKFLELQQVMWTTNAGLTDRHTYDSRPSSWPRLRRGIVSFFSFCMKIIPHWSLQNFWVRDHRQIYLLGNPMIWWLSTAAVGFYASIRGLLILRSKRGFKDFENSKCYCDVPQFSYLTLHNSQGCQV